MSSHEVTEALPSAALRLWSPSSFRATKAARLAAILAALPLPACEPDTVTCTADVGPPAVELAVTGPGRDEVQRVTASNFGPEHACERVEPHRYLCWQAFGLSDWGGRYSVRVYRANEVVATRRVDVAGDDCHVQTQRIEIEVPE